MSEFIGKVVLVAGARGAVGVGVAEQFRQKGATVRIVEDEIGNPVDFARVCDQITAEHGRLDLVIQCHGAVTPQPVAAPPIPVAGPTPGVLRQWRDKLGTLLARDFAHGRPAHG